MNYSLHLPSRERLGYRKFALRVRPNVEARA